MSIFFNVVAILLIISGIYHFSTGIRYRFRSAVYEIGKIKIPYWVAKIGASVFIIGLGIYVLIK